MSLYVYNMPISRGVSKASATTIPPAVSALAETSCTAASSKPGTRGLGFRVWGLGFGGLGFRG